MNRVAYCRKGHLVALVQRIRVPGGFSLIWVRSQSGIRIGVRAPDFCYECGAPILQECEQCSAPIALGAKYCGGCGEALPWTEEALNAAREYTDEIDDLSQEEKTELKNTFSDLTIETARTPLALSRFQRYMKRLGPTVGKTLHEILIEVTAETVKRTLQGG
jgi:hypothetical protein